MFKSDQDKARNSDMMVATGASVNELAAIAGVLGLVIGSFLNVVLYRIPKGMSLVRPGSSCPSCGAHVHWYDNVPVVSWIVLRGRCRSCREPISVGYPLVELATGLVFAGLVLAFAPR